MAIKVIESKCKGCGLCVKACPFDSIVMENKIAKIGESCTNCGSCIEACKFGAIISVEEVINDLNKDDYRGVWVFAEQRDGKLMPVVAELLGEGRKLADVRGQELCAVLLGDQVEPLADELFGYGAEKVYLIDHPELVTYRSDAYTKAFGDCIEAYKPEIVLMGATHIGRDLGPCLAVENDTGLTADCTKLEIGDDEGNLHQTRPAFGGNMMATILCPYSRPQMATVRPGVMEAAEFDASRKGELIKVDAHFEEGDISTKVLEAVKTVEEKISLTDAEVIVAGGAGLGDPAGFELLQKLADRMGGVVAASRAVVDAGWIGHDRLVGQTGTTVKPKIYIACGISGAIQHVSGMKESDYIIAINTNAGAPIFDVADYGLVGDLYDVIPAMIDALDAAGK